MNALHEARGRLERILVTRTLALPRGVLRALFGKPPRSPEGFELDFETHVLLKLMQIARQSELPRGDADDARAELERGAKVGGICEPDELSVRDSRIPGPSGDIPVRVYTPSSGEAPHPMLVYLHGGGFVLGSIESHDGLCRALAEKAQVIVVSVEYRLAPEHPFPAGLDDALAATRWVIANAKSWGGDPERVAVGGDSAGGNLSAVVALECRNDATPPAFQLLIYPATDATYSLPSHRHFREGFYLSEAAIEWFFGQYVRDRREAKDPRVSPLFTENVAGAPPALVITAGFDPLRDEGRAHAKRLREAGVVAEHREYEGAIHGFFGMAGLLSIGRAAIDDAVAALRLALHRESATVRAFPGAREPMEGESLPDAARAAEG